MDNFKNYYRILHINQSASSDDIKQAYKKLALKYHPDKNKSENAPHKFKSISEAYQILSDTTKRQKYDRYLNQYEQHILDNHYSNSHSLFNNHSLFNDHFFNTNSFMGAFIDPFIMFKKEMSHHFHDFDKEFDPSQNAMAYVEKHEYHNLNGNISGSIFTQVRDGQNISKKKVEYNNNNIKITHPDGKIEHKKINELLSTNKKQLLLS